MDMGTSTGCGFHQAQSGPGNRCPLLGCRQRYWMQRAHRTDTRSRRRRRIPRRGTTWSLPWLGRAGPDHPFACPRQRRRMDCPRRRRLRLTW